MLGKRIIFSSKKVIPAKREHKLVFISWYSVTVNIANKPNQGRDWPQIQLKHSPEVFVT